MRRAMQSVLVLFALLAPLGWATLAAGQSQSRLYLPLLFVPGKPPTNPQNELRSGMATYYLEADGGGNCLFTPTPDNLMVAAISYLDYGNPDPLGKPAAGPAARYCGAYVEVSGPSGSVVVRIVDKCPDAGCRAGHLDLSPQAFAKIAPIERGIVPITWRVISPALTGPIAYHFKDGSNQWWTAVQVRNHRNPIAKLEYRNSSGAWVAVTRLDYNYFVEPAGMGPGPYSLRVTDVYGNVLIDNNIAHTENGTVNGAAQFPAGP